MSYYDGTKLLSLRDINGQRPEIYICTTNRSAGKTTFFGRLCVNRWLDKAEKFCLIYRFKYELSDCANKFYRDIGALFFNGTSMTSKAKAGGIYHELYIDSINCGYAISLNAADQLKKFSHLLSDVKRCFFDEFQSETNHYCPDEIRKLISVHTSIARGRGEQSRYVPVYMCGNPVSIINPYYVELGISDKLKSDTKFLRGNGFVLEQGFNASASSAQLASGFNLAFQATNYVAYSAQSVYLNDNSAFIGKPYGHSTYLATLKCDGAEYALREYERAGFIYCDYSVDSSSNNRLCVTTDDHQINYVMLRHNDLFLASLRYYFDRGCFRFKDLRCKSAVLKALSY